MAMQYTGHVIQSETRDSNTAQCTAIGVSSGEVILTIQTMRNIIINYIY